MSLLLPGVHRVPRSLWMGLEQQTPWAPTSHTSSALCGVAMHPSLTELIRLHLLQPPPGDKTTV